MCVLYPDATSIGTAKLVLSRVIAYAASGAWRA